MSRSRKQTVGVGHSPMIEAWSSLWQMGVINNEVNHFEERMRDLAREWDVPVLELASVIGWAVQPDERDAREWVQWRDAQRGASGGAR